MFITVNHMIPILSFILPYLTAFKPIVLYRETASTKKESKKKKKQNQLQDSWWLPLQQTNLYEI